MKSSKKKIFSQIKKPTKEVVVRRFFEDGNLKKFFLELDKVKTLGISQLITEEERRRSEEVNK